MSPIVVAALYHFVTLNNYKELRQPLLNVMLDNDIKGTLLLAHEGINGTVAGSQRAIDTLLTWLKADSRLEPLKHKVSYDDSMPFYRTRVKLKKEIVTMGVSDINPNRIAGTYVKPQDWNALICDPEVTLIDTRNEYETCIGTFKNAIDPKIDTFREFPDYVKSKFDARKHKRVAMFCTGGIRCEKSTAYMKALGFENVYHLQGGILKYLEEIPQEESLWQGECFVFDNRVSVNHDLQKGAFDQCHACRTPITDEDKNSQHYIQGVSCPHCHNNNNEKQRQRFMEREKQIQLSKQRGETHIGSEVVKISKARKQIKLDRRQTQRHREH